MPDSRFWTWASRANMLWPWLKSAWPVVVPSVAGVIAAYMGALEHLRPWQVYMLGLYGLAGGVWIVAGARLAYLRWSPWGKVAQGERALHHRQLISTWRAMVTDVQREYNARVAQNDLENVEAILERHTAFPSFRPYLSDESKGIIWGGKSLVDNPAYTQDELVVVMNDIDRLEQEWRLR